MAVCALAGAMPFALAPVAHANSFLTLLGDYRVDGRINPCAYSLGTLQAAQGQIPNDIEQYAPDFPSALAAAVEAQARGDCKGKKAPAAPILIPGQPGAPLTGGGGPSVAGAPAKAVVKPPPAPPRFKVTLPSIDKGIASIPIAPAASRADVPWPLVLLGLIFALMLISGALAAVVRPGGWEPRPLLPVRHAWGEATFRLGTSWSGLVDRVRPTR